MPEIDLMNACRLRASELHVMLFRTNVGKVRTQDGRWFDTGLPKGHADLYGILPGGRCIYVETKVKPRKPTKEQCQFLIAAINQGAVGCVAYSVQDMVDIIQAWPLYKERILAGLYRRLDEINGR